MNIITTFHLITKLHFRLSLSNFAPGVWSLVIIIAPAYSTCRFRSAFELTNNARAYFYPSLTLTAEGGFQSLNTEDLFQPGSVFYNLIAGLTQPIFSRGENRARLKLRKARQKQALFDLRNTILNAGREVSDALSQYNHAEEKLELRTRQLEALEKRG